MNHSELLTPIRDYHAGLAESDPARVRGALGPCLTMYNGAASDDPRRWQAHLFLAGEALDRWPAAFLEQAGPYENRFETLHAHERGDGALVVTRDSGRNRFRRWNDETVVWLLGRVDHAWKIVGLFIRDAQNPE